MLTIRIIININFKIFFNAKNMSKILVECTKLQWKNLEILQYNNTTIQYQVYTYKQCDSRQTMIASIFSKILAFDIIHVNRCTVIETGAI